MESIADRLGREEIELASFWRRFWAYIIDEVAISFIFMAIYYDAFVNAAGDLAQMSEMTVALTWQVVALRVLYQWFFVWYYGATPGKMACKIVVLDAVMLSKPDLLSAFVRSVIRALGEWAMWLGFIWAYGNEARQGWHDKAAKTIVCKAY